MNVPAACDIILDCLRGLDLYDVEIVDGGVIVSNPPDKYIELLGTEDGDEEHAAIGKGPNTRRRPYSLGFQVCVTHEGLDQELTKLVRDEAFEIYEVVRSALLDLSFVDLLPSAEKDLEVVFVEYQPAYTSKSRRAYVAGLIRVIERD